MFLRKSVDLNRLTLLGTVVQDPKFIHAKSGKQFGLVNIATGHTSVTIKDNQRREEKFTSYTPCYFNGSISDLINFIAKGDRVYIEGRLNIKNNKHEHDNGGLYYTSSVGCMVDRVLFLSDKSKHKKYNYAQKDAQDPIDTALEEGKSAEENKTEAIDKKSDPLEKLAFIEKEIKDEKKKMKSGKSDAGDLNTEKLPF